MEFVWGFLAGIVLGVTLSHLEIEKMKGKKK